MWRSESPSPDTARQGVQLSRGWMRQERVPFDEMEELRDGLVLLRSGERRAVPPALRPRVAEALQPLRPSGSPDADYAALVTYLGGDWSPLRAARYLLSSASAAGASDVHVEASVGGIAVRLRQMGSLGAPVLVPQAAGVRMIAALQHLSGCLPDRQDLVQEGRIPRDGVAADVRASFIPTALGERVALRLFGRLLTLDELGLSQGTLEGLRDLLAQPSGLVLVAGPSGGGKTTTVYAALQMLALSRDGAHLSIEDPVEQRLRLAGIAVDQVELCPERGLTAEAALQGALRQDVDVVALSEIRNAGEARLALHAAHTGRLVVAGLHAGSAPEAIQRMRDLGADPQVLAQTLQGVLHQRLVTVDCPADGGRCVRCGGVGKVRVPVATLLRPQEDR